MLTLIDLHQPEFSYFFGLLQADGHLAGSNEGKGKVVIELKLSDRHILETIQKITPVYSSIRERNRDTNFKKNYSSVTWTAYNQDFRKELNSLGLPYGKKSKVVNTPTHPFSEPDYYRGIIDGDGSLGLTGNGFPFLSLVTTSTKMCEAYEAFLFKTTGKNKRTNPTSRDDAYNICISKEDAQAVVRQLYYPGCLCLGRKLKSAQGVLAWRRPSDMVKVTWERKKWTPEEDAISLALPLDEATEKLGRTKLSVKVRKSRLTKRVPHKR